MQAWGLLDGVFPVPEEPSSVDLQSSADPQHAVQQ